MTVKRCEITKWNIYITKCYFQLCLINTIIDDIKLIGVVYGYE
jgi:hypothetical protein